MAQNVPPFARIFSHLRRVLVNEEAQAAFVKLAGQAVDSR